MTNSVNICVLSTGFLVYCQFLHKQRFSATFCLIWTWSLMGILLFATEGLTPKQNFEQLYETLKQPCPSLRQISMEFLSLNLQCLLWTRSLSVFLLCRVRRLSFKITEEPTVSMIGEWFDESQIHIWVKYFQVIQVLKVGEFYCNLCIITPALYH